MQCTSPNENLSPPHPTTKQSAAERATVLETGPRTARKNQLHSPGQPTHLAVGERMCRHPKKKHLELYMARICDRAHTQTHANMYTFNLARVPGWTVGGSHPPPTRARIHNSPHLAMRCNAMLSAPGFIIIFFFAHSWHIALPHKTTRHVRGLLYIYMCMCASACPWGRVGWLGVA